MTVADRIRERRRSLELSQEDLAKRAGYTDKTSISKFENSGNDISMKQVNRLAAALNCSSVYLMGWTSEPKSTEADPIIVETGVPIETLSRIRIQGEAVALTDPDEIELIEAYRSQPPIIRNAARRVLGLKEDGIFGSEKNGTA